MQPAAADGNRAGRAGGNHSGFCAGELRKLAAYAGLQLKHVDKEMRRLFEGLPRRRYLQRAAQVGPGATPVDQGPDTNARIEIVGEGPLGSGCDSGRHGGREAARANVANRGAAASNFMKCRRPFWLSNCSISDILCSFSVCGDTMCICSAMVSVWQDPRPSASSDSKISRPSQASKVCSG